MNSTKQLDFPTRAKSVPASDESPVGRGGQSLDRRVTRMYVARVEIQVRVREMRGRRILAVGHESLEIEAITIVLTSLRDGDAITLTEQSRGNYWSRP